jgi:hypothetical protein
MFDFSANALNTSKEATQAALQDLMGVYVSQLNIQLGISSPKASIGSARLRPGKGQDPDKYLSPPTPGAMLPPIMFEEAIDMIMEGQMPRGTPAEGAEEHFQSCRSSRIPTTIQHPDAEQVDRSAMPPESLPLFKAYYEQVAQQAEPNGSRRSSGGRSELQQQAHPEGCRARKLRRHKAAGRAADSGAGQ